MIAQGLVLLSDADLDAPDLPGIGTVSKDDAWDAGAYYIGLAAASEGAVWVDRPYWTGHPDAEWMAAKCDRVTEAGGVCQLGNEQNLDLEGWEGGPEDWAAFDAAVRSLVARPDRVLTMPPSPGVPGWESWVTPDGPHAVHCYGTCDQMIDVVDWFLQHTVGDVYVTECNPGAGQEFDLDAWAQTELVAFLDWCASEPRVRAVLYFAWRWDQSPTLPSSIDAAGSVVPDALAEWTPPMNGGADDEWYPLAVRRPISVNYTPGRAGTVRAVVEHIADGLGSCYPWFDTDRGENGSSAHFWVGRSGTVEQYRPLSDTCWANGPICDPDVGNPAVADILASGADPNARTVAVEHEGYPDDPLTPEQTAASRDLTAWLCARYGLATTRDDVIGHYQLDNCDRAFCPGPSFPWADVLNEPPTPADDPTARADRQQRTWDLCDQLQALADEWNAAGWPSTGVGVSSAAESIKSHVRATKGER